MKEKYAFIIFVVNIKWGKEKFDAVEVNTDEPPMLLKAQLFALSGVQPEHQKVMVKGQVIKVSTKVRYPFCKYRYFSTVDTVG